MSKYDLRSILFIQECRAEGYSWNEVADEYEKEFGERRSHDTLRMAVINYLPSATVEVEEEEMEMPRAGKREPNPLPAYLMYEPKTYPKPKKEISKGTALIIPDVHWPYADQRAYNLMLKVAQDVPDLREIVILGDWADFYAINSHGKHPKYTQTLVEEISVAREKLEELVIMFPKAKRVFIEGNHEHRLARYIYNNAPDLFGIIDVPTILSLNTLGFEFIKYGPNQKYKVMGSNLYARHEPIGGGTHAANSTVDKAGCSMIFGHIHRIQQYRKVFIDGNDHLAASVGWLGDKNSEVMGYLKNHAQWQLGWGFVTVLNDGKFFLDTKHIIDYTTVHNGTVYKT